MSDHQGQLESATADAASPSSGPQRPCSLCGEGAMELRRRLWFRHWSEVVAGEGPPVELQAVCARCRGAEQRQSLLFLGVLGVAVILAAAVVAWALL